MAQQVSFNGKSYSFPDDASAEEIKAFFAPQNAAASIPDPIGAVVKQMTAEPQLSPFDKARIAGGDAALGSAKALGDMLATPLYGLRDAYRENGITWAGSNSPVLPEKRPDLKPNGTGEKVGYYGTQLGALLAPSYAADMAAEEVPLRIAQGRTAVGRFTKGMPTLSSKLAREGTRVLSDAIGTGTVNKAQGGDFSTGAMAGTAGAGLKFMAPAITRGIGELASKPSIPAAANVLIGLARGKRSLHDIALDAAIGGLAGLGAKSSPGAVKMFGHVVPMLANISTRGALLPFDRSNRDDQRVRVIAPDGSSGTIPISQLGDAIAQHYKLAQ